jgi:hypothetical protein
MVRMSSRAVCTSARVLPVQSCGFEASKAFGVPRLARKLKLHDKEGIRSNSELLRLHFGPCVKVFWYFKLQLHGRPPAARAAS